MSKAQKTDSILAAKNAAPKPWGDAWLIYDTISGASIPPAQLTVLQKP